MTDDKVAGEGMQAQAGICKRCFDDHEGDDCVGNARSQGLIDGRKAERERCLKIIERWRPMTKQTWVTVSDEIGGQDGE